MGRGYSEWVRKWLEARSLSRAVRIRRTHVYEVIKREWLAIALGKRIASDEWERAIRVAEKLRERAKKEHPKAPHEWEQWVAAFAGMLSHGSKSGLWAVSLPPFAMELGRPRSPFSPGSVAMLRSARTIEQALLNSFLADGNSRGVDGTAQILCSSILLGGLQSWKRLMRLAQVRAGYLYYEGDMLWADLPNNHEDQRDVPQMSRMPTERQIVSRWLPDPVSALLLLRRVSECRATPDARLLDIQVPTREALIGRIRLFLAAHGCPISLMPRSMNEMFEIGAMRLLQDSMGVIVAYAKGQVQSASFAVEPWARVRTGLALAHQLVPARVAAAPVQGTPPAALASAASSGAAINALSDQMLGRLLKTLGLLSNRQHVRRKKLAKEILYLNNILSRPQFNHRLALENFLVHL